MTGTIAEHTVTEAQASAQTWLDQEHEATQPPDKFSVLSLGAADWALRKVQEQDALLAATIQAADEEIARWETFKAQRRQQHEERTAFLRGHLEVYTRGEHDENGRQTITLPSGKLSLRKRPASIEWPQPNTDEETALVRFATNNDMATATVRAAGATAANLIAWAGASELTPTISYSKTTIKDATTPTPAGTLATVDGEVVPGIRYDTGGELIFSIK